MIHCRDERVRLLLIEMQLKSFGNEMLFDVILTILFCSISERETQRAPLPGGLCSLRITSDAGVGLLFLICEQQRPSGGQWEPDTAPGHPPACKAVPSSSPNIQKQVSGGHTGDAHYIYFET